MIQVQLFVTCHKCGLESTPEESSPENGWYSPYYVEEADGYLQTQLCPKCRPKISLYMYLRRHPEKRFLNMVYAHLNNYFWMSCPSCDRKFGGHEKHGKGVGIMISCGNC